MRQAPRRLTPPSPLAASEQLLAASRRPGLPPMD
jgi:hypothetical protein